MIEKVGPTIYKGESIDKYQPYKMAISNQGSFSYDGYNLSSDYVGQEWQPRVIMEIDTAGVYTTSFILV